MSPTAMGSERGLSGHLHALRLVSMARSPEKCLLRDISDQPSSVSHVVL